MTVRPAPTISVVLPLYNHARYIEAALASVLRQTSPADEIILIDDGSTDDGISVAERVLAGTANARIYRQPNQGAHVTINRLVGFSRGVYVAILNSDDLFAPDKLARCREILDARPGIGLLCGALGVIDDDGRRLTKGETVDWLRRARRFHAESGLLQLSLLNENAVATTSNMVFSRSLWASVGGFQNLRYCHDLDFLMAAFARGSVVIDDDHEHMLYRVHAKNTIKENLDRIRMEIAAVIACALCESGGRLFGPVLDRGKMDSFLAFLNNKGMTGLICLLQTLFSDFPSRGAFYDHVADPARSEVLMRGLRT